ncbi:MAG: hypothetical protein JWM99_313 [Verrucomicrobiales bacterium]|nr:hypothetical protein [Verrucomicrobiales bacterium]
MWSTLVRGCVEDPIGYGAGSGGEREMSWMPCVDEIEQNEGNRRGKEKCGGGFFNHGINGIRRKWERNKYSGTAVGVRIW